jgi:zinc protease
MTMITRLSPLLLTGLAMLVPTLSPAALAAETPSFTMSIQQVRSPGGIEAWLVEEHSLPLLTMSFAFMGGSSQDPKDKPGVANILTAMLDEGAGETRSQEFQERIEDLAVKMSFDAGRDSFSGSFQTLTENRDEAADLLALALGKPRFDPEPLERMRSEILAGIKFDEQDPDKVASDTWFRIAFPGHPYGRPVTGTLASVQSITREDLEAYRSRVFARDNLKVAVVGDIDAAALGVLLDRIFGGLAGKADLAPVPETEPQGGPTRQVVEMDVPQSVAQFGHGAIGRKDDDYMAAFILNYIIGGGGFSSRLMEEVREKRGLAYSVYTYMQSYQKSSLYLGGVATKNEAIGTSLEVIRNELERMASEGPSPEDLEDAKRYLIGSYALRFDSGSKIASQLLGIQIEDLGIDYITRRNALIGKVTIEDIRRVAKRLLKPGALIVTVVGKPSDL